MSDGQGEANEFLKGEPKQLYEFKIFGLKGGTQVIHYRMSRIQYAELLTIAKECRNIQEAAIRVGAIEA